MPDLDALADSIRADLEAARERLVVNTFNPRHAQEQTALALGDLADAMEKILILIAWVSK